MNIHWSKKYISSLMFCCLQNYGAAGTMQSVETIIDSSVNAEIIGAACRKGRLGIHRERAGGKYLCTIAYSPNDCWRPEELQYMASDLCSLVKKGEQEASTLSKELLASKRKKFALPESEKTDLVLEVYTMSEKSLPAKVQSTLIHLTGLYVTLDATVFAGFSESKSAIFASSRERYIGKAVYQTSEGLKKEPIAVSEQRVIGVDELANHMFDVHAGVNNEGYITVIAGQIAAQESETKCSIL